MRLSSLAAVLFITQSTAWADTPTPVWQFDGFKMPESVVYDAHSDKYYVSNINGGPLENDQNGSIGFIDPQTKNARIEWVTGFDSPKGLALRDRILYVADVNELVLVNVDKGDVVARYPAPNSQLLNGIAISDTGDVYVSDWLGNRIYTLTEQGLTTWFESVDLASPNGLAIKGEWLYVAAWGASPKADFSTESSGNLMRISLDTAKLDRFSINQTWVNLDGLHPLSNNQWLTTDFMQGKLLTLNPQGEILKELPLAPTAADFAYRADKNLLIVPYLMSGKVAAYHLNAD